VRTVATTSKNSTREMNMPTVSHRGGGVSLYYENLFNRGLWSFNMGGHEPNGNRVSMTEIPRVLEQSSEPGK
jgi:hypothetical protein